MRRLKKIKLLIVAGARPNFMKIAPLLKAVDKYNKSSNNSFYFETYLVHTGQHYDENMSDIFFKELNIGSPDFNIGIGSDSYAYRQQA